MKTSFLINFIYFFFSFINNLIFLNKLLNKEFDEITPLWQQRLSSIKPNVEDIDNFSKKGFLKFKILIFFIKFLNN